MGSLLRAAFDLVVPPHCPTCDRIVPADGQFCAACFATLPFVVDPSCRRCGQPFASRDHAGPDATCEECCAAPPPWDAARAAFRYEEGSRRLILPLKYADRTENARVLGGWMARAGAAMLDGADLLVPVPLHRSRLRARRYNQAALLARAVRDAGARREDGAAVAARPPAPRLLLDGLVRVRRTGMLARKTAKARLDEMKDAIAVRPVRRSAFAGRRVVLVDDVLTTGATARACVAALREAGVAWVGLLVAARTPPRV